jgi:threonine dehydratase
MEIIEDVPEVDFVVVPIGGAGLIAGISCAIKTLKPECKVCYCFVARPVRKTCSEHFLT